MKNKKGDVPHEKNRFSFSLRLSSPDRRRVRPHSNPFSAEEKLFSSDGMEITLTKAFRKTSVDGYTVCYDSSKVAVFALKEAFSLAEGLEEMTLDDYRKLVLQANESKNPQRGEDIDSIQTMVYNFYNQEKNTEYRYLSAMYKAGDAFWLVQFACEKDVFDEYQPHFVEAAKSVAFPENDKP